MTQHTLGGSPGDYKVLSANNPKATAINLSLLFPRRERRMRVSQAFESSTAEGL